jgi:uncharacterized phiE125 gp8 family phage protein
MGTSRILTVTTAPTEEPITLSEAKQALAIEHDEDDIRIDGYIETARQFAEQYCDIKIPSQVVQRSFDNWPSTEIDLDVWPLQSIDSVKYDDTASPVAEQTLTADTDYYRDTITEGGRVRTITGWPSHAVKPNAIRISMTAGYASRSAIPQTLKDALKAYVVYLYEQDCDAQEIAMNILQGYRRKL